MKTTKTLHIILICVVLPLFTIAQISLGPKAGLNLANMAVTAQPTTILPSFQIGGMADFTIYKFLSVQPQLLFSGKGFKQTASAWGVSGSGKANLYYLEIPVNIMFKTNYLGNAVKIFGGIGPYIGIGLAGKVNATVDGNTQSQTINWGNKTEDDFRRTDVGLGIIAGAQHKSGIQAAFAVEFGLRDLSTTGSNDFKATNLVFSFTVGYMFGMKKK